MSLRRHFQSSTKIEALREELDMMRAADPGAKAIVFSQFTSMLELIRFRLEQVTLLERDEDILGIMIAGRCL